MQIPPLAKKVLEAPYQQRVNENALLLLYWDARARCGPFIGPGSDIEEKPDGHELLRRAFREMRPDTPCLDSADPSGAQLPDIVRSGRA